MEDNETECLSHSRQSGSESLKRAAPQPISTHFDTKRRRHDSLSDRSPRSDHRDIKHPRRDSSEHLSNRKRHLSASGDHHNPRRSSDAHRHVEHPKERGTRDSKYSNPRPHNRDSWRSSRSPRNGHDLKDKSPSSYSTSSTRELSRYYSELGRSQRQERSPHQEPSERSVPSRQSSSMNPDAMNLLVGLSKILK